MGDEDWVYTSSTPDRAAAVAAGLGAASAVTRVPARKRRSPGRQGKDRTESYEVEGPDGEPVKVTRNIETGETEIL